MGVGVVTAGASMRFGISDFPHATIKMTTTGITVINNLNFGLLVTELI